MNAMHCGVSLSERAHDTTLEIILNYLHKKLVFRKFYNKYHKPNSRLKKKKKKKSVNKHCPISVFLNKF